MLWQIKAKRGMLRLHAGATPFYGDLGLNAGVLMLSLERVRASNFTAERDELIAFYQPLQQLPLGDQDVLNAYGSRHPEQIFKMPCLMLRGILSTLAQRDEPGYDNPRGLGHTTL